jgi:glutathione S-transferase
VRAWRAALAERPSVRDAVPADYHDHLLAFLHANHAYLAAPQLAQSA